MNWQRKVLNFIRSSGKKTVILVNVRDNADNVSMFFNLASAESLKEHLVVFFGMKAPLGLNGAKIAYQTSEEYLKKSDYESIDNYIFGGLSRSWYLYKNAIDYHGIHLGQMFEYDFAKFLTPRIKNLSIIGRIIKEQDALRIVAIDDTGELIDAARLYAAINGLDILEVSLLKKKSFFYLVRAAVYRSLSNVLIRFLDRISLIRLSVPNAAKTLVSVDSKLFSYFKDTPRRQLFIPCPMENSINERLNFLKNGSMYVPLCFKEDRRFRDQWLSYKKMWHKLSADDDFKNIFYYENMPIWEMVRHRLQDFFFNRIPVIICNINKLQGLSKSYGLKAALLRNDVREFERSVIFGLRLNNIPTVVLQHGILAEYNGHNILLADRFAAWGNSSIDWYKKFGNCIDKIIVTGNPRFDRLSDWKPRFSLDELCSSLGMRPDKKTILFATQQVNKFSSFWTDDLFWVMSDAVMDVLRQMHDFQLIIKADPYESADVYKKRIPSDLSDRVFVVKDLDIYSLITISDLLVTMDSTVALEAMVLDKPVLTFNITKRDDRVNYAASGAAIGVYNANDLASAIKGVLTDPRIISNLKSGRGRFIDEYAYCIDGKAHKRILGMLVDMLEAK